MSSTLIYTPPRTIRQVWESLPEGTHCQIIHNSLIMSPSPSDTHQKISGKIFAALIGFVEKNNLGEIRYSPYDVYFDEGNIFQPDIVFIATENVYKIKEKGLFGAPDLVIEILSPSNGRYDKEDKKEIYEKSGVREYFIIEPFEKIVTGYLLVNDEFVKMEIAKGEINSKVLQGIFKF